MPRPDDMTKLFNRASEYASAGRYREAETDYLALHRQRRRDPEVLRRLALVQAQLGRNKEAVEHIRRAAKLEPRNAMIHFSAGLLQLKAGLFDDAIVSYTRATHFAPKEASLWCGLATALDRTHQLDRAERAIDSALALEPDNTQAAALKGALLRRRGHTQAAADLLGRVVDSTDRDMFRVNVAGELGNALDKLGRYAEAFSAWTEANQAALSHRALFKAFDAEKPFRGIDRNRTITSEQFARWKSSPVPPDGVRAVFLVGMPRSGTTMTEQLLCTHPQIHGTSELPILSRVFERLHRMYGATPLAEALDALTPDQIAELRAVYKAESDAMLTRDGRGATLLLDKNPMQLMSAPLISRIFPDARFIVAIRDPRDVCLSCYQQTFSPNNSALNFLDIERTARLYAAVMGMWLEQRGHYAFGIHQFRYEDLTADLETHARALVAFLGLEWDESLLTFHERKVVRPVNTPSYEAVTQPVHRGAVDRWRNYADQLKPILPTLLPFMREFGYSESGEE